MSITFKNQSTIELRIRNDFISLQLTAHYSFSLSSYVGERSCEKKVNITRKEGDYQNITINVCPASRYQLNTIQTYKTNKQLAWEGLVILTSKSFFLVIFYI